MGKTRSCICSGALSRARMMTWNVRFLNFRDPLQTFLSWYGLLPHYSTTDLQSFLFLTWQSFRQGLFKARGHENLYKKFLHPIEQWFKSFPDLIVIFLTKWIIDSLTPHWCAKHQYTFTCPNCLTPPLSLKVIPLSYFHLSLGFSSVHASLFPGIIKIQEKQF